MQAMRRVSSNVFVELYFFGCNPGFLVTRDGVVLIDTPQQPIDAVRWRERAVEHGPIRYLINTEPHPDHIRGNAFFPGVEVVGHTELRTRYLEAVPDITGAERRATLVREDPDSVWLYNHPSYPPNPPTRLFEDELTLQVGDHEVRCMHMPGHTPPQTTVYLPREHVAFTGDNVFHQCKTFIQEADPWQWLEALDRIGQLDVDVIVPGHGEPCDKSYLAEQGQIIRNWIGAVEDLVSRGLTEDDAVKHPLDVQSLDPYPIGQRLFAMNESLDARNVRNLYRRVRARRARDALSSA